MQTFTREFSSPGLKPKRISHTRHQILYHAFFGGSAAFDAAAASSLWSFASISCINRFFSLAFSRFAFLASSRLTAGEARSFLAS
jgi:hypothetical protein